MFIGALYLDQLVPSIEYCKSGFAKPNKERFEVALAVATMYDWLITFTSQVAVLLPSCVATTIIAVPCATAVIFPSLSTEATDSLSEVQVTDLSVASSGDTVEIKVLVSPTTKVVEVLYNEMPVTWITVGFFSATCSGCRNWKKYDK